MVWVVGDQAIAEKLDQSHWDGVKDLVIDGLRKNTPAEGLCAAIKRCGELLAQHFPIAPDDVNELSNDLRLID
jgi:putative membrane protein